MREPVFFDGDNGPSSTFAVPGSGETGAGAFRDHVALALCECAEQMGHPPRARRGGVDGLDAENGVRCSMSRSVTAWDNAVMESFFSSLKTERAARKVDRS